jgi:hypothetical protein
MIRRRELPSSRVICKALRGVIRTQRAKAAGALHLTLEHATTLSSGDLLLSKDEAAMTPLDGDLFLFRQTQTVVKGAGTWEGAAGVLTEIGVVDMAKGQGGGRYTGRISHS